MVLTEVFDNVTRMRLSPAARLGSTCSNRLERTLRDVEIVPMADGQFRAAVERYAARSDQRWSLTDCASFLVMEQRGIADALAYDRDFEQAGFAALLRGGAA